MTEEKIAIAKDYYQTGLDIKQIKKKYKISQNKINRIANDIDFNIFQEPEKKYVVIKVEEKNALKALAALESNRIDYEVPEKYELTEYIESKINQ